jgi:decaheme c-type cytochrome, OmcA/MtrC family
VRLCVLCHQPQNTDPDTGNTLNLKVMVHKIHMGSSLPSVKAGGKYHIIGFNQSDNDFSTVVFPQDIRNCAKCHEASAPESQIWYTRPTRAACASCHDDIDWVTGANHPAGPQADDTACASCHVPQGDQEYDASIKGAHTVPYRSTQLKGINATILSVTNARPGQKPTVQFQLKQNDGAPITPATLGANLTVLMGGPTTDYGVNPLNYRERADGASFDGTTATFTLSNAIPADATGTWAFGLEARRTVKLDPGPRLNPNINESAFNPVFYAAVTDGAPVPRRKAVDVANCNVCHDQLAPHGRSRRNTELCVICHNPNESDRRPASKFPPEAIDFKRMIHRIHTGENLTQDFTVIGTSGSGSNFNDVRFPGDRRDCVKCHVPGAQQVPEVPPEGLLPTTTLRDWYTPQQHFAAACLGCHDSKPAAAHAYVMTAPFGESCAACHGPGAEFAVDKVHAR